MTSKSRSVSSRVRLLVGSSMTRMRERSMIALADLDDLAGAHAQAPDGRIQRKLGVMEEGQGVLDLPAARAPAEDAGRPLLTSEHHVLFDGQMRGERELLVDHRDAVAAAGQRIGGTVGPAVEPHLPAVGLERPAQDLDQGALARSVLPKEGVDLSQAEGQVDPVQGARGAEALGQPAHDEDGRGGRVGEHQSRMERSGESKPRISAVSMFSRVAR